ncbi:MAG: LytTR family transcriptional regulator DNA-binding domain-containing protein [Cyclobacteriaceae bacterium]
MSPTRSILVVEDEPLIADDIAMTLAGNGYGVMGPVDNADDATTHLSRQRPDLVLLDINIKGNRDGVQLASEVRSRFKLPFIYITSYYDRGTLERAKATEPQGYILKPFDDRDLLINVEMALFKVRKPPIATDKFFVKDKNEVIALEAADILYAEAFDNYCKVFTEKQSYIVSHTLKQVEEKLSTRAFIRVHRSYLVNFDRVTSITESSICLGLNKVPLAQSYRQELMDRITLL